MKRGFSILEMVFSASFLFMVMLALFSLIPSASWMVSKSRYQLFADSMGRRILEDYRCRKFATVPLGLAAPAPPVEELEGVKFTPTVRVKKLPGVGDDQYSKRIMVSIRWTVRGVAQTMEKEAWLANLPSR